MRRCPQLFRWLGALCLAALALGGCGSETQSNAGSTAGEVLRAEFGRAWPLTVDRGTIRCESFGAEQGEVIFTAPNGVDYALNGLAADSYPAIDPIWRYEPGMEKYELRVSISPLIDRGLALC